MRVRVELGDLRGVVDGMRKLGRSAPEIAGRILSEKARVVAERARPLVPDDPATSGTRIEVRATRASRGQISGRISAAVVAMAKNVGRKYNAVALIQHEDVTLSHERGQAKFVEQPFLEVARTVADDVQDALDQEAERALG